MSISINNLANIALLLDESKRESEETIKAFDRVALEEAKYHAHRTNVLIKDLEVLLNKATRTDDPCSRGQCDGCGFYENCPAVPALLVKQAPTGNDED